MGQTVNLLLRPARIVTWTPHQKGFMKTQDWNASHLGKSVRLKSHKSDDWHYRLEGLRYEAGNGGVTATLVTIVPSIRPGITSHFNLGEIELAE